MTEYTQGICGDSSVILKDGRAVSIEEILSALKFLDYLQGLVKANGHQSVTGACAKANKYDELNGLPKFINKKPTEPGAYATKDTEEGLPHGLLTVVFLDNDKELIARCGLNPGSSLKEWPDCWWLRISDLPNWMK